MKFCVYCGTAVSTEQLNDTRVNGNNSTDAELKTNENKELKEKVMKRCIIIVAAIVSAGIIVLLLYSIKSPSFLMVNIGGNGSGTGFDKEQSDELASFNGFYGGNQRDNDSSNLPSGISIGDEVLFGNCETEGINGFYYSSAPICWIVVNIEQNRVLLLSKSMILYSRYNFGAEDVTWETSDMREFLNNEFYNVAFNDSEKMAIFESYIINSDNDKYGTFGGNNTTDKVFLMSYDEIEYYFDSKDSLSIGCNWWLRSPGRKSNYAMTVNGYGNVKKRGLDVSEDLVAVRPAIWVDISAF